MAIVVKEFDLSSEEVKDIQNRYYRLVALRELTKSVAEDDQKFESVLDRLTNAQTAYNNWFAEMAKQLKIQTTDKNGWEVNFDSSKLFLMEI